MEAAHIISTTMTDGPRALPTFICGTAFLTISMVTGMEGPSLVVHQTGGLGPNQFVCLFDLGLMSLSTIFQSYRDGVWMWQGAQCLYTFRVLPH